MGHIRGASIWGLPRQLAGFLGEEPKSGEGMEWCDLRMNKGRKIRGMRVKKKRLVTCKCNGQYACLAMSCAGQHSQFYLRVKLLYNSLVRAVFCVHVCAWGPVASGNPVSRTLDSVWTDSTCCTDCLIPCSIEGTYAACSESSHRWTSFCAATGEWDEVGCTVLVSFLWSVWLAMYVIMCGIYVRFVYVCLVGIYA